MKCSVFLLFCVLVVNLGATFGDSGDESLADAHPTGVSPSPCPYPEYNKDADQNQTREYPLENRFEECVYAPFFSPVIREDWKSANTSEEFLALTRKACEVVQTVNQCADTVLTEIEACVQTRESFLYFNLTRLRAVSVYDVACTQNGVRIADVVKAVKEAVGERPREFWRSCLTNATSTLTPINPHNITQISLQQYYVAKGMKTCVGDMLKDAPHSVSNVADEMMDEAIAVLPCMDYEKKIVPCRTLATSAD